MTEAKTIEWRRVRTTVDPEPVDNTVNFAIAADNQQI